VEPEAEVTSATHWAGISIWVVKTYVGDAQKVARFVL
jgi:hypothetical protein